MSNDNYPRPPGHRTFQFQSITISSDFDSGNCCGVEKNGNNQFDIWIATDHPKNNYRTWFHFSVSGVGKGNTLTFNVKNMQNQSRLLNEGLVPVYRQQGTQEWKRVSQKVNTGSIEYNEGWIQWTFKHNFKSNLKHYFAFFYPWSNQQNKVFLDKIQQKVKQNTEIYVYRTSIIRTLQGRPVEFLVISSNKHKNNKQQTINDDYLFKNVKKPLSFSNQKPGIIISARVHPGQVPGSHVMTGIIKSLAEPDGIGRLLRDQFVFYIFPILNPDGVGRGHYRVDTNGINLNRCYLNPSAKQQPSIYAIKKMVLHLHQQNRFFAYLDLHAHASRKGTFIYGNCSNQLMKQVKACIFPKLLSMNSIDFQYEGSNFTQKNMYSKDRGDHISKQGSGRVAIFKATKNAYCWTMQCNYNISRINNVLEPKKQSYVQKIQVSEQSLDPKIVVEYRQPPQIEAKQFFTIATYHKLGYQICQTFLDLIQKNPFSRIDNPNNYFKSVKNVKMNLAVALLRMAPNRFEPTFKKIYSGIENSQNAQIIKNSIKALYFCVIKNAKILNINNYIKSGDQTQIVIPQVKKQIRKYTKTSSFRTRQTRYNSIRGNNVIQGIQKTVNIQNRVSEKYLREQFNNKQEEQQFKILAIQYQEESQKIIANSADLMMENSMEKNTKATQNSDEVQNVTNKIVHIQKPQQQKKFPIKIENFRMIGIISKKRSLNPNYRQTTKSCNKQNSLTPTINEAVIYSKLRTQKLIQIQDEIYQQLRRPKLRKGPSFKNQLYHQG